MVLPIGSTLISARDNIIKKLTSLFADIAIEAHLFGSLAEGNEDQYSDIDIWYTFDDKDFGHVYEERFEYYQKIGNVVHICEAPQNAPTGGIYAALIVRGEEDVLIVVDMYLCPLSTSYRTEKSKKLFGMDLPINVIGFNPQKVAVNSDYRIDFFICFLCNAIKKLARKEKQPISSVFREYRNLKDLYGINLEPLESIEQHSFAMLHKVIDHTLKVSNERQQKTLMAIKSFANEISSDLYIALGR